MTSENTVSNQDTVADLDMDASAPPSVSKDFEDFIYLISHDVRSSVRALIELPQWLADDLKEAGVKMEGPVVETIDLMNRYTGRLDRMLVDLLVYSRIGNMQKVETISVADALAEVLDEINVPLGFKVSSDVTDVKVEIGNRDILSLLTALISNAFKHHDTNNGTIHIAARAEGDDMVLSVADDGPGIVPEHYERVFAAMATLRPRDEVEGSGMGLAIVRKIALHYGGTAVLSETSAGRGLTVTVRIPLTQG